MSLIQLALVPYIVPQYFSSTGEPLSGGLLYTYVGGVGSTVPTTTWQDPAGTTTYTNPIVLNASGRPCANDGTPNAIWGTPNFSYRFLLTDALGNQIFDQPNMLLGGGSEGAAITSTRNTTTLAALGYQPTDGQVIYMTGETVDNGGNVTGTDGTEGWWFFQVTNSYTPDGGTVVTPNNPYSSSGKWVRIIKDSLNVKWFGAKGDGGTNDTGSFSSAAGASAQWGYKPLYVPTGTYPLHTDPGLSVPVILGQGAILQPSVYAAGAPLYICPLISDFKQHFDLSVTSSSSSVVFKDFRPGQLAPRDIYPEWFGASGNNIQDDTLAINAAIQASTSALPGSNYVVTNTNVVLTANAGYSINGIIYPKSWVTVTSSNQTDNKYTYSNFNGPKLIQTGSFDIFSDVYTHGIRNFKIKGIGLSPASGKLSFNMAFATQDISVERCVSLDYNGTSPGTGIIISGANSVVKDSLTYGPISILSANNALIRNNKCWQVVTDSASSGYIIEGNQITGDGTYNYAYVSENKLVGIIRNNTPDFCNDDWVCVIHAAVSSGVFTMPYTALPAGWNQYNTVLLQAVSKQSPDSTVWSLYDLSVLTGAATRHKLEYTSTAIDIDSGGGGSFDLYLWMRRVKQPSIDGTNGTMWTASVHGT